MPLKKIARRDHGIAIGCVRDMVQSYQDRVNKQELLRMTIAACIDGGINTEREIVGIVPSIGEYSHAYVAVFLKKSSGDDGARYSWFRDGSGTYHLHDQLKVQAIH